MRNILQSLLRKNYSDAHYSSFPNIEKLSTKLIRILATRHTPIFIGEKSIVSGNHAALKHALETHWHNTIIAYSFKTNYSVVKQAFFKKLDVWAEVVSRKEFDFALHSGFSGAKIIFNGPVKNDVDLQRSSRVGALIHIDNIEELNRLSVVSKKISQKIRIGLRLSTPKSLEKSRFGFPIGSESFKEAIRIITSSNNLSLKSLHMHIGTDVDDSTKYYYAAKEIASVAMTVEGLEYIDMGGGFPSHALSPYNRKTWKPTEIQTYIQAIKRGLTERNMRNKPTLIVEPGRYLIDDALCLVTQITSRRIEQDNQVITVDASVTMLPLRYYRRQIVRIFNHRFAQIQNPSCKTLIFGSTCQENDLLFEGDLVRAKVGDYLVFYSVGAYNQNMGSNFITDVPGTVFI